MPGVICSFPSPFIGVCIIWKLAEHDRLRVSRVMLRGWMVDAGLWLSRKQRRTFISHGCDARQKLSGLCKYQVIAGMICLPAKSRP
jgi:hypothetical protein